MCDICGDPNCPGVPQGTSINELTFTEESLEAGKKVFEALVDLCKVLNDETGLKQVEQIKKEIERINYREDKCALGMMDVFLKYQFYAIAAKNIMQKLSGEANRTPETIPENTDPIDPKKLN